MRHQNMINNGHQSFICTYLNYVYYLLLYILKLKNNVNVTAIILILDESLNFVYWLPKMYYKQGPVRIMCRFYTPIYAFFHICCVAGNAAYKYQQNYIFNVLNFFVAIQVNVNKDKDRYNFYFARCSMFRYECNNEKISNDRIPSLGIDVTAFLNVTKNVLTSLKTCINL